MKSYLEACISGKSRFMELVDLLESNLYVKILLKQWDFMVFTWKDYVLVELSKKLGSVVRIEFVGTHPDHRQKGLFSEVMRLLFHYMDELKIDCDSHAKLMAIKDLGCFTKQWWDENRYHLIASGHFYLDCIDNRKQNEDWSIYLCKKYGYEILDSVSLHLFRGCKLDD